MLYRKKPNSNNRHARMAKKNVTAKVECGCRKNSANFFWPVVMQFILIAAKSFIEECFK